MINKVLTLLSILAITGCATSSPTQHYRTANNTQMTIAGTHNEITGKIEISIDNKVALSGNMPQFFGSDVEFSGTYSGMNIDAYCNTKESAFSSSVQCLIFVDNDRATTLTFQGI